MTDEKKISLPLIIGSLAGAGLALRLCGSLLHLTVAMGAALCGKKTGLRSQTRKEEETVSWENF